MPHEIFSTFCGLFLLLIKRRDAGNILVSFQRRWTSIYYFLDSQIFDQVLDIFPWLSYRFTFIMLNVGMVDKLEFWYTIFTLRSFMQTSQSRVITFFALIRAFAVFLFKVSLFIVLWIFTSNILPLPLCQICRDKIKDQIKHKVNPPCFWNSQKKKNPERFVYYWILQTFIHSWKNQRKRANFNCKWCISLLIEHW